MDMTKPHKGSMEMWKRVDLKRNALNNDNLGYYIVGVFKGHPDFHGQSGHTSMVTLQEGNEIETLNSRYTLGRSYDGNRIDAVAAEEERRSDVAGRRVKDYRTPYVGYNKRIADDPMGRRKPFPEVRLDVV